jgi:hypothetical protein
MNAKKQMLAIVIGSFFIGSVLTACGGGGSN